MQKDLYGPYTYEKDGKTVRFYLSSTKSRNTIAYIKFGMIILKVPNSIFNRIISSKNIEEAVQNFLVKYHIFKNMSFKGNNLSFEENITEDHVYIKGVRYDVSKDFNTFTKDNRTFYVSSFRLLHIKFDELALAYFKKRVEELRIEMEIPVSFEVKLSDATTFKGQNNFVKNVIKLDSHLYSYKECVADAVIIHELAHYYHHDHSRAFYDRVLKYCPNYKRYTKIINEGRFESE